MQHKTSQQWQYSKTAPTAPACKCLGTGKSLASHLLQAPAEHRAPRTAWAHLHVLVGLALHAERVARCHTAAREPRAAGAAGARAGAAAAAAASRRAAAAPAAVACWTQWAPVTGSCQGHKPSTCGGDSGAGTDAGLGSSVEPAIEQLKLTVLTCKGAAASAAAAAAGGAATGVLDSGIAAGR